MMTLMPVMAFAAITGTELAPSNVTVAAGTDSGYKLNFTGLTDATGVVAVFEVENNKIKSATEVAKSTAATSNEVAIDNVGLVAGKSYVAIEHATAPAAVENDPVTPANVITAGTLGAVTAPADVNIANLNGASVTTAAATDVVGTLTANVTATSGAGATTDVTATANVDNTVTVIANKELTNGDTYTVTLTATGTVSNKVANFTVTVIEPVVGNNVSAEASSIGFVDADPAVEVKKSVDVQAVLKDANGSVVTENGIIYVWAETTANQASDAFKAGKDANEDDVLDTVYPTASVGVYKVSFGGDYANEFQAQFTRKGNYTIKASLVDPTEKLNKSEAPAKQLTQTNKTIAVSAAAADGDNWKISVTPGATTAVENGKDLARVDQAANGRTQEYTLKLESKGATPQPISGMKIDITANGDIVNKTSVTTTATGEAKFKLSSEKAASYIVSFETASGGFTANLPVTFGGGEATKIEVVKAPTGPVAFVSGVETTIELNGYDVNGNKVANMFGADKGITGNASNYEVITKPSGASVKVNFKHDAAKDASAVAEIDVNKVGSYEVKLMLDNGKSVKVEFEAKKQGAITSMKVEYDVEAVGKGAKIAAPDVYQYDADGVERKVTTGITYAVNGPASISTAGVLTVSDDKEDIGKNIVVTVADQGKKVVASATLVVTAAPSTFVYEATATEVTKDAKVKVFAGNDSGQKVGVSTGYTDVTPNVTYVVTEKPEGATVVVNTDNITLGKLQSNDAYMTVNSNKPGTVKVLVAFNSDTIASTGLSLNGVAEVTFGKEVKPANNTVTMVTGQKMMVVDGKAVMAPVAPFVQDNRTFLPMRALAEAIGAEIAWDQATQTVTLTAGDVVTTFVYGGSVVTVNGEATDMGVKVMAVDQYTVLPVRFAAEAVGYEVEYTTDANGVTTVTLTK